MWMDILQEISVALVETLNLRHNYPSLLGFFCVACDV